MGMYRDFWWFVWGILVSPKRNTISFGAENHVQKSRNHENDGFSGFPNNEIGKLLIQNEAE